MKSTVKKSTTEKSSVKKFEVGVIYEDKKCNFIFVMTEVFNDGTEGKALVLRKRTDTPSPTEIGEITHMADPHEFTVFVDKIILSN